MVFVAAPSLPSHCTAVQASLSMRDDAAGQVCVCLITAAWLHHSSVMVQAPPKQADWRDSLNTLQLCSLLSMLEFLEAYW